MPRLPSPNTAVGRTKITFRTLELWSGRKGRVDSNDYARAKGRFYLRANVEDHPGVLADITAILGKHKISIASVLQHEIVEGTKEVPLVIVTHETTEGATRGACAEIDELKTVTGSTVRLWIRD